jgi:hypothetical protein
VEILRFVKKYQLTTAVAHQPLAPQLYLWLNHNDIIINFDFDNPKKRFLAPPPQPSPTSPRCIFVMNLPHGHLIKGLGLINLLVVVEKRGALSIGHRSAAPVKVTALPGNDEGHDKENRHDDKGKDPLEGSNVVDKLGDANGGREHAERKAHGVVLVNNNVKESIDENGPNKDIAKDAGYQIMGPVHHNGTVPVNRNKGPGQRGRDDGHVNVAGIRVVAKVLRRQVEKVGNERNLGPDKVVVHKEQNKGKVEQVVEDKVTADAGGRVFGVGVARKEGANIADLGDEEEYPKNTLEDVKR